MSGRNTKKIYIFCNLIEVSVTFYKFYTYFSLFDTFDVNMLESYSVYIYVYVSFLWPSFIRFSFRGNLELQYLLKIKEDIQKAEKP